METPRTPLHPTSNEEITRANIHIPEGAIEGLDLNPGISEDSDANESSVEQYQEIQKSSEENSIEQSNRNEEEKALISDFESAYAVLNENFDGTTNQVGLTNARQSNFVNYVDEELLKIQRIFVKSQAGEAQKSDIWELLERLTRVYDLVWFSVNKTSGLFGQEEYFIKLMNDLEDYVSHSELFIDPDDKLVEHMISFFKFMQTLDVRMSILIDGFEKSDGTRQKLSNTQVVRIKPLATRLRTLIVYKLDTLRSYLTKRIVGLSEKYTTEDTAAMKDTRDLINALEVEISRLFEGVLDRVQQ